MASYNADDFDDVVLSQALDEYETSQALYNNEPLAEVNYNWNSDASLSQFIEVYELSQTDNIATFNVAIL